jgi:hypothetical protein
VKPSRGALLDRRRLARVVALVPRILDAEAERLPDLGDRAIREVQLTSTGMAVILVGSASGPPCAVVKVPAGAQAARGLEAEGVALSTLHADLRLEGWRDLVPRPRGAGTVLGCAYRVDSVLPGGSMSGRMIDDGRTARLVDAAAETIHELHRRTARELAADDALIERWVDEPIRELVSSIGLAPGDMEALRRLRGELHASLHGHAVPVAAVHGDFWLGNVLFSGGRPTGVVDWDASGPSELPLVDLLHLALYTRRQVGGRELGAIVCRQLADGAWSRRERRLLEPFGPWRDGAAAGERPALLLSWLRHVVHRTRQEGRRGGVAQRLWVRRNVRPVLGGL